MGPPSAGVAVEGHISRLNQRIVQVAQNDCFEGHSVIEFLIGYLDKGAEPFRVIQPLQAPKGKKAVSQSTVMVEAIFIDTKNLCSGSKAHLLAGIISQLTLAVGLQVNITAQKGNPLATAEIPAIFNKGKDI